MVKILTLATHNKTKYTPIIIKELCSISKESNAVFSEWCLDLVHVVSY